MEKREQQVSTEAQRLTLEAMSAQLVHKLHTMIAEQEARAREFAAQHHTTISIPRQDTPAPQPWLSQQEPAHSPQPQAETATSPSRQAPRVQHQRQVPVPPLPTSPSFAERPDQPTPAPLRMGPKKKTEPESESNIGLGMVIFALVGIIMLLRSCS